MKLLVVEDDPILGPQIKETLQAERYNVDLVADGETGLRRALCDAYSLVVLDVMLPKRDGWSICEAIRTRRMSTPILMLTARDSVEDRVKGLEGGADDYLAKPFDARELLARVRALLRRDKVVKTGVIHVGELEVDTKNHRVQRAGKEITLTPREYTLLEALARNEGRTLTREVILESVWNAEESLENTVNFHVTSLRKKLDAEFETKMIQTVHGFGYRLVGSGGSD